MNSKYDVSIIIINYNGKRYIDGLFQSLVHMNTDGIRYEILVVNNASEDGSISYLRQMYGYLPNLKIIDAGGNLGYAGGNNKGVENAEGEYIIFLNNDTAVDENWMVNLYSSISVNEKIGMVNSKLLFYYDFITVFFGTDDKIILSPEMRINGLNYKIDNKFCKNVIYDKDQIICFGNSEIFVPVLGSGEEFELVWEYKEARGTYNNVNVCGKMKELSTLAKTINISIPVSIVDEFKYTLIQNAGSGINEYYDGFDIGFCEKDSDKYSIPYEISGGCGASIILRREDFLNCGGFDERFFMYYEDMDLSFRIKKNGKKIMFCPTSIVRHIHTGSSTEWSPFFCYQVSRNKLLFIFKNISKRQFVFYFIRQFRSAVKEHNKYQRQGCIDALRILLLDKKATYFDKWEN